MELPFVRLSTLDFETNQEFQPSEQIIEQKIRKINLSTKNAKQRLRNNFAEIRRKNEVNVGVKLSFNLRLVSTLELLEMDIKYYF